MAEQKSILQEYDRYISALFASEDDALKSARSQMQREGMPEINVSASSGKLLQVLARIIGAHRILEIGTLGGYSTIWLARGMATGGSLITLEANPRHAEVARLNIARAGFADRVEVRIGPARDTLPQLATEGRSPFDLIFIDADKENYAEYLGFRAIEQWAKTSNMVPV